VHKQSKKHERTRRSIRGTKSIRRSIRRSIIEERLMIMMRKVTRNYCEDEV